MRGKENEDSGRGNLASAQKRREESSGIRVKPSEGRIGKFERGGKEAPRRLQPEEDHFERRTRYSEK